MWPLFPLAVCVGLKFLSHLPHFLLRVVGPRCNRRQRRKAAHARSAPPSATPPAATAARGRVSICTFVLVKRHTPAPRCHQRQRQPRQLRVCVLLVLAESVFVLFVLVKREAHARSPGLMRHHTSHDSCKAKQRQYLYFCTSKTSSKWGRSFRLLTVCRRRKGTCEAKPCHYLYFCTSKAVVKRVVNWVPARRSRPRTCRRTRAA